MDLSGWGRYPVADCHVHRPSTRPQAEATVAGVTPLIPRGLGRSYADSALAPAVLDDTRLGRITSFDAVAGVVTCEGGVSLATLIEVFLPRGWFLPVTPGTKHVTVGGAIAADVHGKNHHVDGSFIQHVDSFTLLTPTGRRLTCSRNQHKEAFWATAGGMGLTGLILEATIRLKKVSSGRMTVTHTKARHLDAALDVFAETDAEHTYSVAWIDCLARGSRLGRSVVMHGDHAPGDGHTGPVWRTRRRPGVPIDFPRLALSKPTVKAFNAAYYAVGRNHVGEVDIDPYFYPLDGINNWNRLYGKRGFVQFQCALPDPCHEGMREILTRIAESGRASFLAVLKRFGPGNQAPLSFPMEGATLALDLPADPGITGFLQDLYDVTIDHGGRTYLAKDAALRPDQLRAMYPDLAKWQRVRDRLDPDHRFQSMQSQRLHL